LIHKQYQAKQTHF